MKFIIDENLTPELAGMFRKEGLDAHHVNELKSGKKQRVIDDQLRRLAIQKRYVIVTKDDDFVKSYVDRKVPDQMVFIHGLETKESLLSRMKEVIPQLIALLESHDFVEVNGREIRFPFSD
ncbi:MAG: DUF5615 family PIN-like protein [Ekhidna sp.]|uniref:DUF5615 family PIN-like protein n=1 Tax=Ekhidna sp. TaxID=2608089 RepID=UPI0032EDE615